MAVHNCRPFLSAAVESVLTQTYTDFELIIIDDGSTDGSAQRLRDYAARDRRIRLVVQANVGLTVSLNRGVDVARGEYIARMDGDDVCLPTRFERQVHYLDRHPNCVLVGGQVRLINEDGRPIHDSGIPSVDSATGGVEGLKRTHTEIDRALLEGRWPLVHPAVMMRRDAVRAVGGYDERFVTNQDHDLFLKLAEVGQLANITDVVIKYRRHRGQVTTSSDGRDFSSKLALKKARRAACRRRGRPIPGDLRWTAVAQVALRKLLSQTPCWSSLQNGWGHVMRLRSIVRGR
jgi:glycosyltransferase involved in cell wall biosynthesis